MALIKLTPFPATLSHLFLHPVRNAVPSVQLAEWGIHVFWANVQDLQAMLPAVVPSH